MSAMQQFKINSYIQRTTQNWPDHPKCHHGWSVEPPMISTYFTHCVYSHILHFSYSTPEGRAAEGGTPEGRAVSVTRELDLSAMQDLTVWPPSCVISENSRSLAAIFFSDGNTRHCSGVYISRDLIWIKIVVGKTINKHIVIILAIRFAVVSTIFQWK